MRNLFIRLLPGLMLLLVGCSVGPDYVRPDVETDVPAQWARPTLADALPDSTTGHWHWWEAFGDTTLNGLVTSSLAHNNDLAAAAGRVLEADALLGGARSARLPSLEIGGAAARNKATEATAFTFGSPYQNSFSANATGERRGEELSRLVRVAREGVELGLCVHAGHGLTYENVIPVAAIPQIEELNIGHSIISRAVFVGLERAVREMGDLIKEAPGMVAEPGGWMPPVGF